jgi:hypothetical protein
MFLWRLGEVEVTMLKIIWFFINSSDAFELPGSGKIVGCLFFAETVAELGGRYGLQSVYTFNNGTTKESCTLSHGQLVCAFEHMRVETCGRKKEKSRHIDIQTRNAVFPRYVHNSSSCAKRCSFWHIRKQEPILRVLSVSFQNITSQKTFHTSVSTVTILSVLWTRRVSKC